MTAEVKAHKGAPLVMLTVLLGCWVVLRSFTWAATGLPLERIHRDVVPNSPALAKFDEPAAAPIASPPDRVTRWTGWSTTQAQRRVISPRGSDDRYSAKPQLRSRAIPSYQSSSDNSGFNLTAPPAGTARPAADALPALVSNPSSRRRWSVDAWLFLRQGGQDATATSLRPATLGGSQAGAIIRYDLRPDSRMRVDAYLRASQALVEQGEREAAVGLAARPVRNLPVALHAEIQVTGRNGDTELRPAIFTTTGLQQAVAGIETRGYAQAGFVGGELSTGFADGQLVAEKRIADTGSAHLSLGLGIWGGAQKGATRLDIGPVASAELKVAGAPVRLEASYRQRVAADAQPDSGFALKVSTGF